METSNGGVGVGVGVGDGGAIGVDCSVGTIVWVRRRNGSWWPGRILDPEELSASHLMSPRSGTPVKLLGREDASVDWYNLEKSKRVKAFRCGEFDACIEKAEASQNVPIKKREKYARREDAILHALELEKQQVELNQQKLGSTIKVMSSKKPSAYKSGSVILSSTETCTRHHHKLLKNGKLSSHKVENLIGKVIWHLGEDDNDSLCVHKGSDIQKLSSDDDNGEVIPRIRGLQDFGFWMAQSKRRSSYVIRENSSKCNDNPVEYLSNFGYVVEGAGQAGISRNCPPMKRKRSTIGVNDEILAKKRDRRRPLVQVMQSSAKLSQHVQLGSNANGIPVAEEMEHLGSICRAKRSRCIYLPVDSKNYNVHDGCSSELMPTSRNQIGVCNGIDNSENVSEECSSGLIEASDSDNLGGCLEPDAVEHSKSIVSGKFRDLTGEEVTFSGLETQLHRQTNTDVYSEMGVSKWHMKGKRNIRNIGKRLMDGSGIETNCAAIVKCNGSINPAAYKSTGRILKSGKITKSIKNNVERNLYALQVELQYADEGDPTDKDLAQTVYDNGKLSLPQQSTKDDGRSPLSADDPVEGSNGLKASVLEPFDLTSNALCKEHVDHHDQVCTGQSGKEMEPLLVDVDLKVQAAYQGEHVPLVSLMSRLNGQAIIGHPVQVEILEDVSASHFVSKYHTIVDDSTAPSAMWHTARRTAMQRVPRPIPSSATFEELDTDLFQYSDRESKPLLHRLAYSGDDNHQTRLTKKRVSLILRSGLAKFQKKNVKRVSSPGRKTRKLSSLAANEKPDEKPYEKPGAGFGLVNVARSVCNRSLLISELSGRLVTCVPTKVVFSRILEAVGRPSSSLAHRATTNSIAAQGLP